MKRYLIVGAYALGVGLAVTILSLTVSLAVGTFTSRSIWIPGVVNFQQSDAGINLATSTYLPITVLVASVVIGLPVGSWMYRDRVNP